MESQMWKKMPQLSNTVTCYLTLIIFSSFLDINPLSKTDYKTNPESKGGSKNNCGPTSPIIRKKLQKQTDKRPKPKSNYIKTNYKSPGNISIPRIMV